MAYYDQYSKGKRPARRYEDNWEDEGTRYSDAGNRRFGPGQRAQGGEGEKPRRPYTSNRGPARPAGRPPRPYGERPARQERPEGQRSFREHESFEDRRPRPYGDRPQRPAPRPREEERPQRSYLDFEHQTPPPRQEAHPDVPENLLAGRNPIREAIKSGRDIEKLLVMKGELSGSARQIVQMAREAHIPVQEVEKSRLDEITPHHQGMLAFASAYSYSTVEDMLAEAERRAEEPFLIILDGITDPQNLGAIIRSAECVGAHGVIVRDRRSVGLTPAAVKASAGAVEHMKVARVTNITRLLEDLKRRNIWTYALAMEGEDYLQVDFSGGVALVVGSEGEGISRLTEEACDRKVALPMLGALDSLNASVAAGVMMYRVLASRRP